MERTKIEDDFVDDTDVPTTIVFSDGNVLTCQDEIVRAQILFTVAEVTSRLRYFTPQATIDTAKELVLEFQNHLAEFILRLPLYNSRELEQLCPLVKQLLTTHQMCQSQLNEVLERRARMKF